MAERTYIAWYLVLGDVDPDVAEECPECGFDALLSFPLSLITERGVTPWRPFMACVRCWQEAHPEDVD